MAGLAEQDAESLKRFFRRALDLYAAGAVTADSVVEYLEMALRALDSQDPGEMQIARGVLDDAWREDDA
jgi:hypothetical protein